MHLKPGLLYPLLRMRARGNNAHAARLHAIAVITHPLRDQGQVVITHSKTLRCIESNCSILLIDGPILSKEERYEWKDQYWMQKVDSRSSPEPSFNLIHCVV